MLLSSLFAADFAQSEAEIGPGFASSMARHDGAPLLVAASAAQALPEVKNRYLQYSSPSRSKPLEPHAPMKTRRLGPPGRTSDSDGPAFILQVRLREVRTPLGKTGWFDQDNKTHQEARQEVAVSVLDELILRRLTSCAAVACAAGRSSQGEVTKAPALTPHRSGRPPTSTESAGRWAASSAAAAARAFKTQCFTSAAHTAAFVEHELLRQSFSSSSARPEKKKRARWNTGEKEAQGLKIYRDPKTIKERVRNVETAEKNSGCTPSSSPGQGREQRLGHALRRWLAWHGRLEGTVFNEAGERWIVVQCAVDAETRQKIVYYELESEFRSRVERLGAGGSDDTAM